MAALKCNSILLLLIIVVSIHGQTYKLCAKHGFDHECSQLRRLQEIECNVNVHGVDCVHNIQQGQSDFGKITAEEALIAANFVQDVVVVGEIRSDAIYDDALYSTVVLVKEDYPGGFTNLRGKKFCHPGFKYDKTVTELLLKEFERLVLQTNKADACLNAVPTDTLAEKELKSVFEFFGPSCRPGPWSEASSYNTDFYNRYDRLCELCNSPQKCTVPNDVAPFMYSLECLLRVGGGDLALTTLNTVKEYFDSKPENTPKKALYRYLCRDGSVASLDKPCVWSKQLWDLIIANKKHASKIRSAIEQKWSPNNIIVASNGSTGIGTGITSAVEDYLKAILFSEPNSNKINLINETPLQNYIQAYRGIPNTRESTLCGQHIRWCTISEEEQEKCLWLAQASLGRAIQPVIDCVKSTNKITCLQAIENDKADVVTSDAHYGYLARKKGLAPIAYPDTEPQNIIRTLIVVKNKDAGTIQKFADLKNKKACFPEYGGIEWLAFINTARKMNAVSNTECDYGSLINGFLGDSCIPGTHDKEHEVSSAADKEKLCRLCLPIPTGTAWTCNTDESNQYYGNKGALKCLNEVGDFAVITKGDYPNINPNEFRVICQNGTIAANVGFDVDPTCALSETIDSEVVTKRKQPNKNKDIEVVLLNYERRFGRDGNKPFEVFNIFNNIRDLLFKDSTPGLVETDSNRPYVKNYADMFAHTDKCVQDQKPGGSDPPKEGGGGGHASALQTPIVTITVSLVFLFICKLLS